MSRGQARAGAAAPDDPIAAEIPAAGNPAAREGAAGESAVGGTARSDAARAADAGRRRLIFWGRLVLGVGLLAFILLRVDLGSMTIAGPAAQAAGVVVLATIIVLAQFFAALRWRVILGPGAPPAGYLFRLYLIGCFFSLFLPTSVGGDAVRTVAAVRATGRPAATVSSVLADRLAGVAALGVYLVIGAMVAPGLLDVLGGRVELSGSPLLGLAAAAAVGLAATAAAALVPKVRVVLRQAVAVFVDLARARGRLLAVAALAMVVQGIYILGWWALGAIVGLDVPAAAYLLAVPVVSAVAMLPVTLSGLGVREGAWLLLLAPFGVAAPDAVAFSLLYFVAFAAAGGVGGGLFALRGTGLPSPAGAR